MVRTACRVMLCLAAAGLASACTAAESSTASSTPSDTAGVAEPRLTAPSGFVVTYFARQLPGVRFMALGSDGAVYASQPAQNRVLRIWDMDHDGVADSVVTAVDGLHRPHGLAFHGGYLYIANTDGVVRVRLTQAGRAAGAVERLNSFDSGAGHWTRTVIFGPDSMMYVSIGSSCNLCVESKPERASVMRYDANGQNGARFASGLRNAVGMAVDPATNQIWVSQNERDDLPPDHQNLPPEEINILQQGGDYGWPYCYTLHGAPVPNPEFNNAARCAGTIPAALEMQAHSAPLGLTFLTRATHFPADYRGDLLLAFHGSWDRTVPTGAKVVRVHVANDRPASYDDFITGWQVQDGSRWGRPVDVLVYSDGSVLISDDVNGAIYRVHS